jgi:hypothetical protein
MFKRTINILKSNSFFLFDARGTGKTTLLRDLLPTNESCIWIDLLTPSEELRYGDNPASLRELIERHRPLSGW